MFSMTLLDACLAALQTPASGLPGAIACILLFAVSCVARAQTGRMHNRARRLRPAKDDQRDERLPNGGGRCDRGKV